MDSLWPSLRTIFSPLWDNLIIKYTYSISSQSIWSLIMKYLALGSHILISLCKNVGFPLTFGNKRKFYNPHSLNACMVSSSAKEHTSYSSCSHSHHSIAMITTFQQHKNCIKTHPSPIFWKKHVKNIICWIDRKPYVPIERPYHELTWKYRAI